MTAAPLLPGLSIVLPCLDEEANVTAAVVEAEAAAFVCSLRHEIIVVDDGSTDRTREVASELAALRPTVRLVVHTCNRGYGAAVRSGIRAAGMPYVLLTDADLQFYLLQLYDFLPEVRHADVIIGYRAPRQDPLRRRVDGALWNRLVRTAFRLGFRDVDCAFKLAPRDLLTSLDLTSDGAMISTELLVKSLRAGASIRELPVRHRPRRAGRQTGADAHVVAHAFREFAALRQQLAQSDGASTATTG